MYRINFGNLKGTPLHTGWTLMPDRMNRHEAQQWWKNQRTPGQFFPTYDDSAFIPTTVPGSFSRVHPELELYEGTVIYLNRFDARLPQPGERALLQFEAVAERCRVFLNGQLIGEHDGGYTAFTLDITAALQQHNNRLMVIVDNLRREDHAPGLIHDWLHDGGIHRPVRLHYRPAAFVRDVAIRTTLAGDNVQLTVSVLAEATRRDANIDAAFTLTDPDTHQQLAAAHLTCRPGSWTTCELNLPRDTVRLWSPDDPHRYNVSLRLNDDHWTDVVGLREIRTAGRDILLNDQPITLRGVYISAEDPDCGIYSLQPQAAQQTIATLRDLGCNFARAGHRPPSAALVRACDEAGILLWLEVPAYWQRHMHWPGARRAALHALEGMMIEHRNAASAIIWSVGNESLVHQPDNARSNLSYFIEAAEMLREHDPSRLVSYAGGVEGTGDVDVERDLPAIMADRLDVLAINTYSGIHAGSDDTGPLARFEDNETKVRSLAAHNKPVIITEAGIDAVLGREDFDFGQTRQAEYHQQLQDLFAQLVRTNDLQGLALFTLYDYRTPIKLAAPHAGYSRKGLLTETSQPKPAYNVVKQGYQRIRDLTADHHQTTAT